MTSKNSKKPNNRALRLIFCLSACVLVYLSGSTLNQWQSIKFIRFIVLLMIAPQLNAKIMKVTLYQYLNTSDGYVKFNSNC